MRLGLMRLVREHPKGEQLFTAPPEEGSAERRTLGPSPWPVCIFWDPPRVDVQPKTTLEDDPRVEISYLHSEAASETSTQETSTAAIGASRTLPEEQPRVARRTSLQHSLLVASGKVEGTTAPAS